MKNPGRIGRITTAGVITEFTAGLTTNAQPDRHRRRAGRQPLVHGEGQPGPHRPDHARGGHHRVHGGPHHERQPSDITAGPDGNLWFTEFANPAASAASRPPASSPSSRRASRRTPSPPTSPRALTATSGSPSSRTPAASDASPPPASSPSSADSTEQLAACGHRRRARRQRLVHRAGQPRPHRPDHPPTGARGDGGDRGDPRGRHPRRHRVAPLPGDHLRRRVRHDDGIRRADDGGLRRRRRGPPRGGRPGVRPGPRDDVPLPHRRDERGRDHDRAPTRRSRPPPHHRLPRRPRRRPQARPPPARRHPPPPSRRPPWAGRWRPTWSRAPSGSAPPGSSGYVVLDDVGSLPVGSTIDARDGVLALSTALPGGGEQTGTFWGGLFGVRQDRGTGMTHLLVRRPAGCSVRTARARRGVVRQAPPPPAAEPPLGERLARALQHPRREQRGDRPRDAVAHGRALRRHADPRGQRPRARPGPADRPQGDADGGPAVPGPGATLR